MKDAYYFSHDANARNDLKMVKLRRISGLEGIGLYWCIIEILRESENYQIPESTIDDICYDLYTDRKVFESIIECELLTIEDEMIFSNSLNDRMQLMDEKRQRRKKAGEIGAKVKAERKQKEAMQEQCLSNAEAMQEQCTSNASALTSKEKKGKESKVKESKRKKPSVDKSPDFINQILLIFQDEYFKSRNQQFELVTPGKERSAIGKLLKIHKEKNADKSSAETLQDFRDMFSILLKIRDKWHYEKMSPAHIAANFNQLRSKLTPQPETKLDIESIISKL